MKVKKYIAPTMPEIMRKIRADLGSEAVILNSKQVQHGGFLGLFKKSQFEVVAALDPQPLDTNTTSKPSQIKQSQMQPKNTNAEVLNEIKYLRKIIDNQSIKSHDSYLPDYQLVYQYLLNQEVQERIAVEIMDAVMKQHEEYESIPSRDVITKDVQLEIERRLAEVPLQGITYKQKVIHFVGPTGVGKTTTIAKLAANSALKDQKKVAFITTDTYRIAAIDQLKTYARILDIPIEVAYTKEDYQEAIKKLSESHDLILTDTAGRNYRDEKYIKELTSNLHFDVDYETYLVLSLTAKSSDVTDIFNQFNHLPIRKAIFTKADETTQYGSLLNIALNKQIGVAYLTNGQDVPDDIIQPSPKIISNYLLGGYFDE